MSLLSTFLTSGEGFDLVFRSYCEQLAVNQAVSKMLKHSKDLDRSISLFYLSVWSHEPFSSDHNITCTLEGMLVDCKLRS